MFASDDFLRALQGAASGRRKAEVAAVEESWSEVRVGQVVLATRPEVGVGGHVWEASQALANWLQSHETVEGRRVLELGAGTGLLGLLLAECGAHSVALTDRFDVLPVLNASVVRNPTLAPRVQVLELAWGVQPDEQLWRDRNFDWIVASECIYNGLLYDKLLATIRDRWSKDCTLFMSFERRSSEDKWMKMMHETFVNVESYLLGTGEKQVTVIKCWDMKEK